MPQPGAQESTTPELGLRSALAQWHLAVRTDLKRTSSLPTAMFDACDPMLETRLSETAELMLACLQGPRQTPASSGAPVEGRVELVSAEELQRLPRSIHAGSCTGLELETGLVGEYLAILTDTCCKATGEARDEAVQLLSRDFALGAEDDLQQVATLLSQRIAESLAATDATTTATDGALVELCQKIAAMVALHQAEHERTRGEP